MCEDYDTDNSDAVPDTRTQANVAAKRTPSGNPVDGSSPAANGATPGKPPISVVGPDGASDSGYSSHTAATIASADSAQSSKTGISSNSGSAGGSTPSAAPRLNVPTNASPRRRPSQPAIVIPARSDPRASQALPSPKKSQSRHQSRPRRDTVAEDYPDPSYLRGRRPQPAPIQTRERGYSYTTRAPQSASYYQPPSPEAPRRPHRLSGAYTQPPAIVQQDLPVRRRSSSTAPRPTSFHYGMTGMTPEQYYAQMHASGYGSAVQDPRAPPLSSSAWSHGTMSMHPSQQRYPVMGATPPSQGFMPPRALPSPTMVSQELTRVGHDRHEVGYSTRNPRRSSMEVGTVILQQDRDPFASQSGPTRQYSTRYPTAPRRYPNDEFSESSSEEDDDEEYPSEGEMRRRQDKLDMPPPMMIPNRGHRASQSYSARGGAPVVVNPLPPQGTPTRRPSHSRPRSGTFTPQDLVPRSPSRSSRRQSTTTRPQPGQYYSYHARSSRDPTAVQMHVERSGPVQSSGQRLRRRESWLADDPGAAVKQKRAERTAEAYIAGTGSGSSSRRQSTYRRVVEDRRKPSRRQYEVESESESEEATSSEEEQAPRRVPSQRRPSRPEKLRTRTAPSTQPLTEKALKRRSGVSETKTRDSDASTSRTSSGRELERHTSAPASTISAVERTKDGYKIRVEGGTLDFGDLRGQTLRIRHADDGSGGAEFVIGGDGHEDDADGRTERSGRGRREKKYHPSSSKASRTSGSVVTKGRRREMDLMKEEKSSRKSSRRRRDVE
jgi:hypothetical protein